MSAAAQSRIDSKLALLAARELYQKQHRISLVDSEYQFAEAFKRGEVIPADDPIRRHVRKLSAASLNRWRRMLQAGEVTALAGDYGNRKEDGIIDRHPGMRDFVIGLLVRAPHCRITQVAAALRSRFAPNDRLPSLSALKRWVGSYRRENAQTLTALANPDAWKGKYMAAFGSASEHVVRVNQLWELDSTPADVMLVDGRHTVLGLIDVYSRRAKLLVSKTSKATAVAQLVRGALLEFGVPEEVKTDNGQDYKSKHVARVFSGLGIKQTFCPPFSPWLKPHVERFFGTFSRDLVELLAGFIGHNVAERAAIEARQSFADRLLTKNEVVKVDMTAADFQKFCDDWLATYAHEPHAGLEGATPFAKAQACRAPLRAIQDERALDVLLGEGVWRTVQKKGIEIDGAWFIAPELEAHVGEKVLCLALPDLGRVVVQGGPDLGFVCIAECPERTGIDRKEVAAKARERQKARVQEARRALRTLARRERTDEVVDEILAERSRSAAGLRPFPKPTIVHDSVGLSAAADAVAELSRQTRSSAELMTDAEAHLARERLAVPPVARGGPRVFENPADRVLWVIEQRERGAVISEEDRVFANNYKRAHRESYEGLELTVRELLSAEQRRTANG